MWLIYLKNKKVSEDADSYLDFNFCSKCTMYLFHVMSTLVWDFFSQARRTNQQKIMWEVMKSKQQSRLKLKKTKIFKSKIDDYFRLCFLHCLIMLSLAFSLLSYSLYAFSHSFVVTSCFLSILVWQSLQRFLSIISSLKYTSSYYDHTFVWKWRQ